MSLSSNCTTCDSCEDILRGINAKLTSIADNLLYNTRYELNREVDRDLFTLLVFYKQVAEDLCNDEDCGCYTIVTCPATLEDIPNTGNPTAKINTCICGCCPPLNPVCNVVPCAFTTCIGDSDTATDVATKVTKQNIFERIKILIA